jgi:zinc transporter 9
MLTRRLADRALLSLARQLDGTFAAALDQLNENKQDTSPYGARSLHLLGPAVCSLHCSAVAAPSGALAPLPPARRPAAVDLVTLRGFAPTGLNQRRTMLTTPPQQQPKPHREPTLRELKQDRELHAVNVAVGVNSFIFVAKVATWWTTSSGALLAEALHSAADIINQLLLRTGVQQSRRPATRQHPYGFHKEKYVYALVSAVGVFCIGAGASVVHGIQDLLDPPTLEHMGYSLAVLGVSSIAEMYSLRVALRALRVGAAEDGSSVWRYMMASNDPTTSAVLAEDAGAVAGLGIAGIASYLTWVTGDPLYDAMGSIGVGCLMAGIAVMLIRNNKRFLIGQAMDRVKHAAIVEHLKADPMVFCVIDPMSEEIGDGVYRFKADIQWSGDRVVSKYLAALGPDSLYRQVRDSVAEGAAAEGDALRDAMDAAMHEFGRGVIRTVGEEIDRIEAELQKLYPGLAYVDLETDRGRQDFAALGRDMCVISPEFETPAAPKATEMLDNGEREVSNVAGRPQPAPAA